MLTLWSDLGLDNLDRSLGAFNDLRREMDRVLNAFDRDVGYGGYTRPTYTRPFRVNLIDNGEELLFAAELPGFTEKDINLTIEQGTLTIRGERRAQTPDGYSVHRQERGATQFARSFTLPSLVDSRKVQATLKNGVLELVMPKAEQARPREIEIKAA